MGKAPLPHNKRKCYPPYPDHYLIHIVTCENSQKGVGNDRLQFTANNERAVQSLKPSSAQKML